MLGDDERGLRQVIETRGMHFNAIHAPAFARDIVHVGLGGRNGLAGCWIEDFAHRTILLKFACGCVAEWRVSCEYKRAARDTAASRGGWLRVLFVVLRDVRLHGLLPRSGVFGVLRHGLIPEFLRDARRTRSWLGEVFVLHRFEVFAG